MNGCCGNEMHVPPAIWVKYGRGKEKKGRTILSSLLNIYATSLNDESLHTLLIEVEAVVYSHPLTANLLSDVNSMIPLSLIHLLTLKSRVVMPCP